MLFGERLKALRASAGLSQPQLAERADVSLPTIKDYEESRREPSLGVAQRLAAALGVMCQAFDGCTFARAKGQSPTPRPKQSTFGPKPADRPVKQAATRTKGKRANGA